MSDLGDDYDEGRPVVAWDGVTRASLLARLRNPAHTLMHDKTILHTGVVCEDMREAAYEIERLIGALTQCAAPFDTGPTTLSMAPHIISTEFQRRMNIAALALALTTGNTTNG